jgi:hypothetical protein
MMFVSNNIKVPKGDGQATMPKPDILPEKDLVATTNFPAISNFNSMGSPHDSFPKRRTRRRIGPKNIWRQIILRIYNLFPNFVSIQVVSPNPRGQKTKIKIPKVSNTHTTKLSFFTNKVPIGQMISMGTISVIPEEMGHLRVNHFNWPLRKLNNK